MSNQSESHLAVCNEFVSKVLGSPLENSLSEIKVSFASKNPKEKNWKKIERTHNNYVTFNDSRFPLCIQEQCFLNHMRVQEFFWLKIEVLG
jgi:hypothetical protein